MNKDDPPPLSAQVVEVFLTVKHILTEFRTYNMEKRILQIHDHLAKILSPDPVNIQNSANSPNNQPY